MSEQPARKYRLRIPALTTAWFFVEAKDERQAVEIVANKINSQKVDYHDFSCWQVEEVR
jgi:hypothetical protein